MNSSYTKNDGNSAKRIKPVFKLKMVSRAVKNNDLGM